jgi:hypothetical protein
MMTRILGRGMKQWNNVKSPPEMKVSHKETLNPEPWTLNPKTSKLNLCRRHPISNESKETRRLI